MSDFDADDFDDATEDDSGGGALCLDCFQYWEETEMEFLDEDQQRMYQVLKGIDAVAICPNCGGIWTREVL